MPLVVFAVVAAVMFAVFLTIVFDPVLRASGYVRSRVPPLRDVAHHFDPSTSVAITGGSRVAGRNVSMPLATLTVDRSWALLQSGSIQRSTVWIGRNEITGLSKASGLLGSGVMFRSADGRFDGVVFWTFNTGGVMRTLAGLGWPVLPPPPRR